MEPAGCHINAVTKIWARADYEEFLFAEAAFLDEWRLEEWLALFTQDAVYEVPTAGASDDADSATSLFYIADDYSRLCHRVRRLMKKDAHSEYPRSHLVHMISNVRILNSDSAGVHVGCVFITMRSKDENTDSYFGHHRYIFRNVDGVMRIASKRSFLDADNLRPQGRVSIIL